MNAYDHYIEYLRSKNYRISKTREVIISLFCSHDRPLSAGDILKQLDRQGRTVNKTTVYRELDFLLHEHIIKPVQIDSTTEYYERSNREHHHHIICTQCKKVQDFIPAERIEKDFQQTIADMEQKTGFAIHDHSFDLYGECQDCRNKDKS